MSQWLEWVRSEHYASSRGGAPRLTKAEREERDQIVVAAVRDYCERDLLERARREAKAGEWSRYAWDSYFGASAQDVAAVLRVAPARRSGRGAVKGSWSGYMSAGLRVAPILQALAKRGLLTKHYERGDYRAYYTPVGMPWYDAREQGRELLRRPLVADSGA